MKQRLGVYPAVVFLGLVIGGDERHVYWKQIYYPRDTYRNPLVITEYPVVLDRNNGSPGKELPPGISVKPGYRRRGKQAKDHTYSKPAPFSEGVYYSYKTNRNSQDLRNRW